MIWLFAGLLFGTPLVFCVWQIYISVPWRGWLSDSGLGIDEPPWRRRTPPAEVRSAVRDDGQQNQHGDSQG
jgi:hypothetical protein